MNLLNDWIPESLLYAMGWTLVHSLWQLVIIGAGLWLLLKIARNYSPALKYNLGMAALGVSVLAVVGTFIFELSGYSPAPLKANAFFADMKFQPGPPASTIDIESAVTIAVNWIEGQLPFLVNMWFLGAMLFLFRLFNSLSEVRILRKSSSELKDFEVEKKLYRLMGKMNIANKVSLRLSNSGLSPVTFGYFKPIILIPAGLLFQLSATQMEAIIAHELAHVKRNDYLMNLIQSALEVLFFYHPCYWWMNQVVKELRENAADDLAVKAGVAPKALAYSLAEVLNFARQVPPQLAMAAGKKRNPTLQRIKRILGHDAQTYPQNPIISIPMLMTLLLSAGLMATAQQDVSSSSGKTKPIVTVPVNAEVNASLNLDTVVDVKQDVKLEVSENVNHEVNLAVNVNSVEDGVTSSVMVIKSHPSSHQSIINFTDSKKFKVQVKGDTIIQNGDTVIVKNNRKYSSNATPDFDFSGMPVLELSDAPDFPVDFVTPPDFPEGAMIDIPEFAMAPMPPMEPMVFDFQGMPDMVYYMKVDTVKNMTPEQKEKWAKEMEQRAGEWAKKAEEHAAKWQEENKDALAKWSVNEDEYKAKMAEWEKKMQPKIAEYEKKMAEWQKAQEPKIKEFETKMKAWEKENQPKIEEFQRKMEIWQKENQDKLEEFQKKIQDEFVKQDKSDDNNSSNN